MGGNKNGSKVVVATQFKGEKNLCTRTAHIQNDPLDKKEQVIKMQHLANQSPSGDRYSANNGQSVENELTGSGSRRILKLRDAQGNQLKY
ncbi:MAG: hypothetical protein EZS28_000355 [Streblomastix strix]|uniref:Uncharacterized protein n=1 Tax=Streblomastix strix TaxID=222440 RepID=A0A5J4XAA7_9EUKA|nr:MAG: hypothetical protein EZS28_000355 [Streblomastix strix]